MEIYLQFKLRLHGLMISQITRLHENFHHTFQQKKNKELLGKVLTIVGLVETSSTQEHIKSFVDVLERMRCLIFLRMSL
jgi:hypothetical protein